MAAMDATMARTTLMDGAMAATMLAPWCYDKDKGDGCYNDKDNGDGWCYGCYNDGPVVL